MKAFGMSTVATSWCYSMSMMHVSRTDSVATVGELESYLDIKSLCVFPSCYCPFLQGAIILLLEEKVGTQDIVPLLFGQVLPMYRDERVPYDDLIHL